MAWTSVGAIKGEVTLEDRFTGTLTQVERRLASATDTLGALGSKAMSAGGALLPLSVAAGAAGVAFGKMSIDLNAAMANIATLIPNSTARVLELKESVEEMSVVVGKSSEDLAGGLYQVISALGDSADTAKILEISAKAAAAGLATTLDAVNLVAAVTKAYGDTSAVAAQKASDLAFVTVKLGQTTFPELAAAIGRVTPLAAKLNVAQEELFAGFATLTGVTGDTAEVSTQLAAILRAMLKPTDDMSSAITKLGFAGSEAMVKQLGVVGSLQKLIATTDGSAESVAKLFGRAEALTAVFALTGAQADTFAAKMGELEKSVGATDQAFKDQTQGVNKAGFELQQFARGMERVMVGLGDVIVEAAGRMFAPLKALPAVLLHAVEGFKALPTPIQSTAVALGIATAAAGPFFLALGSGLRLASLAAEGLKVFTVAAAYLSNTIPALTARVWLLNASEVAATLSTNAMVVAQKAAIIPANLMAAAQLRLATAINVVRDAMVALLARVGLLSAATAAWTAMFGSAATGAGVLGGAIAALKGTLLSLATAIGSIGLGTLVLAFGAVVAAGATLGGHWKGLITIGREIPQVLRDIWVIAKDLTSTIGIVTVDAFQKLRNILSGIVQAVKDFYGWWNDLPAAFRSLFGPLGTLDEWLTMVRAQWPKFRDAVKDWADSTPQRISEAVEKMNESLAGSRVSIYQAETAFKNFMDRMQKAAAPEAPRKLSQARLPGFETLPADVPGALPQISAAAGGAKVGIDGLLASLKAAKKELADLPAGEMAKLTEVIKAGATKMEDLVRGSGLSETAINLLKERVQELGKAVKDTPITKLTQDMAELAAEIQARGGASFDRLVEQFGDDAMKIVADANAMSVKVAASVAKIDAAARALKIKEIIRSHFAGIQQEAAKLLGDAAAESQKQAGFATDAWLTNLNAIVQATSNAEKIRRQLEGETLQDRLNDIKTFYDAQRAGLAARGQDHAAAMDAITAEEKLAAQLATRVWQQHLDETAAALPSFGKKLQEIIGGIPQLLQSALTGGGGFAGFGKALASQLGAAVGGSAFTKLAQGLGNKFSSFFSSTIGKALGAMLPGLGEALGSLIGPLLGKIAGLFHKPDWKKAMEGVGRAWGISLSEELAKSISETSKKLFGGSHAAATLFHLGDVIKEAGGLTAGNFDQMLARLRDVFSMVETGKFSLQQATKVLDENFALFADHMAKSGGLASKAFLELLQLNQRFKTESKAMADFVKAQLAEAAKGFNAIAKAFAVPWLDAKAGIEETAKTMEGLRADETGLVERIGEEQAKVNEKIAELQAEAAEIMSEEVLGIGDVAKLKDIEKQLAAVKAEGAEALDELNKDLADVRTKLAEAEAESRKFEQTLQRIGAGGPEAFDRMGRLAVAQFHAMIASGSTVGEALEAIGPALDVLAQASEKFGLSAGAAFQELLNMRQFTQEQPAIAGAIDGLNQMLRGLHNSGFMTAEIFADLGAETTRVFGEMQAEGLAGDQALRLLQPTLQTLYQLQQEFGYAVDDGTQALLDQAQASGIVGDQFKTNEQKQTEALDKIAKLMERLVGIFGIAADEAEAMATRIVSGLDSAGGAAGRFGSAVAGAASTAAGSLAAVYDQTVLVAQGASPTGFRGIAEEALRAYGIIAGSDAARAGLAALEGQTGGIATAFAEMGDVVSAGDIDRAMGDFVRIPGSAQRISVALTQASAQGGAALDALLTRFPQLAIAADESSVVAAHALAAALQDSTLRGGVSLDMLAAKFPEVATVATEETATYTDYIRTMLAQAAQDAGLSLDGLAGRFPELSRTATAEARAIDAAVTAAMRDASEASVLALEILRAKFPELAAASDAESRLAAMHLQEALRLAAEEGDGALKWLAQRFPQVSEASEAESYLVIDDAERIRTSLQDAGAAATQMGRQIAAGAREGTAALKETYDWTVLVARGASPSGFKGIEEAAESAYAQIAQTGDADYALSGLYADTERLAKQISAVLGYAVELSEWEARKIRGEGWTADQAADWLAVRREVETAYEAISRDDEPRAALAGLQHDADEFSRKLEQILGYSVRLSEADVGKITREGWDAEQAARWLRRHEDGLADVGGAAEAAGDALHEAGREAEAFGGELAAGVDAFRRDLERVLGYAVELNEFDWRKIRGEGWTAEEAARWLQAKDDVRELRDEVEATYDAIRDTDGPAAALEGLAANAEDFRRELERVLGRAAELSDVDWEKIRREGWTPEQAARWVQGGAVLDDRPRPDGDGGFDGDEPPRPRPSTATAFDDVEPRPAPAPRPEGGGGDGEGGGRTYHITINAVDALSFADMLHRNGIAAISDNQYGIKTDLQDVLVRPLLRPTGRPSGSAET